MRGRRKCLGKPQIWKKGCIIPKKPSATAKKPVIFPRTDAPSSTTCTKYMRLSRGLYNQSATAEKGIPRLLDAQGRRMDVRMLRPRSLQESEINSNQDSSKHDGELGSNRIFNYGKTEELWNTAIAGHRKYSVRCRGKLEWDLRAEKQWGLGWIEKLHCQQCGYDSPMMKLFDEVDTGRAGRKSGAPNRALQVGLSHCMIGNTAMRNLLLTLNIPAPAASGMQYQANSVGPVLVEVNKQDMAYRLEKVLNSSPSLMVEGDCRYNNPLQSAGGKTPYQPGTQSVLSVFENVTAEKQVLAIVCKNKHCKVAECLRKVGIQVTCPHHAGHCSANLQPLDPIGNEGAMAGEAFRDMFESCPKASFKYFTTDGDSRAFMGLQQVQAEFSSVIPVHLRDTRHLTENVRFAIKATKFSPEMFAGSTKVQRVKQQEFFALDLSRRCQAEFEMCFKKLDGNLAKIKQLMIKLPDTLIQCYQGDCSQCNKYSFVCGSKQENKWIYVLPSDFQIYPNSADENLLKKLIDIRLGEDGLTKTQLNTTTQKSEAFNRTLSRCLPKCVTFKRNFESRAHAAAHLNNSGIENSIIKKCVAIGAPISAGSRVSSQLKQVRKREVYIRMKMKSEKYKKARRATRKRLFGGYLKNMEEVHYKKGLLLEKSESKDDHSYAMRLSVGEYPSTSNIATRSRGRKWTHKH